MRGVAEYQYASLPWQCNACYRGLPDCKEMVQEKISTQDTINELQQSLEQMHSRNAALQDALYQERVNNNSQQERHWANTAAFMEALWEERANSTAQQQDLEALRAEKTAQQAQPAPATMSLPVRFSGAVHGAPAVLNTGFLIESSTQVVKVLL